jgi:hypothetical protein
MVFIFQYIPHVELVGFGYNEGQRMRYRYCICISVLAPDPMKICDLGNVLFFAATWKVSHTHNIRFILSEEKRTELFRDRRFHIVNVL